MCCAALECCCLSVYTGLIFLEFQERNVYSSLYLKHLPFYEYIPSGQLYSTSWWSSFAIHLQELLLLVIYENIAECYPQHCKVCTNTNGRKFIFYVFLISQLLWNQFTHQVEGHLLNMCALCYFLHCATFIVHFTSHSVLSLCPHAGTLFHVCIVHLHMFFKHCVFDCQIIFRLVSLRVAVMCQLGFPSQPRQPSNA